MVNFISQPTLTGFITSAAFTIPVKQLPKLFGVKVSEKFWVMSLYRVFEEVFTGNANWYDFAIGISTMIILVALKELKARFATAT